MTGWSYPVKVGADGRPIVVQLHDGDTFRLLLDAGCETGMFPWLRVAGADCPELGEPGGAEAAAFTAATLRDAGRIVVHVSGRSFNRWLARVVVDGRDLAGRLIDAGHARRYPA
ncbi:MAG TPA: hypothetical protein VM307_07510 [Egibacteraceae bacterium]|nr:hypothetical protein [Egibacteraceae bacterium]